MKLSNVFGKITPAPVLGFAIGLSCNFIGTEEANAQLTSKRPDLVAHDVRLNHKCQIQAVVYNAGSAPAPSAGKETVKVNGSQVAHWSGTVGVGGNIPTGIGNAITTTLTHVVNGSATLQYRVDASKQIGETNEGNNVKTKRVRCRTKKTLKN